MKLDMKGRVAVVTGGSRGIGYAIAEAFAEAGALVVIGARTADDVERAAKELSGRHDGRVVGMTCDVRSQEDCEALVKRAVDEFGALDILINNAGIGRFASVADMKPDDWRAVIETNVNSLFYCTHAALPHLKARGTSWVINIGSLAGKNPFPNGGAYNASKFALIGFSEALMQEVRHDGVRVSYIMPGSVATDFSHPSGAGHDQDVWKVQPEDIAQIVMDLLAMPERTLPSRVEVRPSRPPK
ncbi:MAG TPA: SDR family oxidoreductase [Longimicrobiales bacterium]|nr:SDR family oxidoreductase [Longimicrobiales bacterium]